MLDCRYPHAIPIGFITLSVVTANVLIWTGVVDANPVTWLSGLATSSKSGFLPGVNTIDPSVGWITQALGHLSASDVFHGHVPWWNPYEGVGSALAGEMGSAALFPLTWLTILPNGHVYSVMGLELISGVSTYFLIRRFTASRLAPVGGAIAYSLNGSFAWISHAVINPIPFLPLILLGIELCSHPDRRRHRTGWTLIALGSALALYGGFPELVYWLVPLLACWTIMRAIGQRSRTELFLFLRRVGIGVATGVALAAPILVSFFDFLGKTLPLENQPGYSTAVLPHAVLSTEFFPYIYGPIGAFSAYDKSNVVSTTWSGTGGYLDSTLLVLAIIALGGKTHRKVRYFFGAWVALDGLRLIGAWPVVHLIALVPGSWLGFQRYSPATWELAFAVLAALGLDDVISGTVRARRALLSLAAAGALLGLSYLGARTVLAGMHAAPNGALWTDASVAWAVLLAVIVAGLSVRRGRLVGAILVGFMFLDAGALYTVPQLSSQRNVTIDYGPVHFLQAHLGLQRFFTLGPIAPNYGAYFGLGEINSIDIPVPKAWASYATHSLDPTLALGFNFVGTSFWQLPNTKPVLDVFLEHMKSYESAGAKYLLVPNSTVLPPAVASAAGLRQVYSDPYTAIYSLPDPGPYYTFIGGDECHALAESLDSVNVRCDRPTTLIRRALYLPGWTATVNGVATELHPYGMLFATVALPAGRSSVAFTFEPPHIDEAWVLFFLGLVIIIGGGSVPRLARRRSRRLERSRKSINMNP
jgi:hypothetical protein